MPDSTSNRSWLRGWYALGLLLIIQPVMDALVSSWPPRFGEVAWRFNMTGSFQLSISTFMVGLALTLLAAYLLRDLRVLKGLATMALLLCALLILGTGNFALDYLQLRHLIEPAQVRGFNVAAAKAVISSALSVLALAALGYAGLKSCWSVEAVRHKEAGEGLIVGRT